MNDVVADTHSLVWFLFDLTRLSAVADAALTAAMQSGTLYISAITLVELDYLAGRPSFPYTGVLPRVLALAADPNEPLDVLPVTTGVAQALPRVPRVESP